MDGRSACCVRRGVVDVGVAAGSNADGCVFLAVLRQYLGQRRCVEDGNVGPRHLVEMRLHGLNHAVRVEVSRHQSVGRQTVVSRGASGDQRGGVDAGDRRKHGMVLVENHAL